MKRRGALKRERVNRALMSIFDYPLTIIEAPVGYGKTTAVRDFLASKDIPVLWTSLLFEDDTPASFWDRLAAEFGKIDEVGGNRLKNLGFPSDSPQTATIISILHELDYKPNTTLVIDDFHLAKNMRVTSLFRRFVTEMPDDFHIVFITRDTSNFDIAELTVKGLCNLLPQQTLKFTVEEVREYCAFMGFTSSENETKKLCEYTGGWISLIYLILLGAQRGIPMGYNSAIDSLIENVLYNAYDERIQSFLLRLSIMGSFTVEQALFVTQEPKAEELLKKLRRENAFIVFDETAGEYKIHDVLLDFLQAKQTDEKERLSLYRLLGEWFLTQEAYTQACGFLCRAGETKRILVLLDEKGNITNEFADFPGSFEMFASAPRELLFKYPVAYLQYIGLLLMSGKLETAHDGGKRLHELHAYYEKLEGLPSEKKNRILAEISSIGVLASFNDMQGMVACTNEALRLFNGDHSSLMTRHNEYTFGCPHFLYSYYKEPGTLKELMDLMVRELAGFPLLSNGCGAGSDILTLAEYALETGKWQSAELNAFKAVYKARTKEQTCIVLNASFALIRLYLFQGKANEGMELLRQLKAEVVMENNPVYNTTLELIDGYVHACLALPNSIPQWLRTGDMSPAHFMYEGMAFNYIVHGKAVLLSKNYIQLEMLTEEFKQYFSIFHNQLGFLHNRILKAAAKYRLYGMEAGCAELSGALNEAQEDHIILPFAEYAPHIIDLMRHIASHSSRDIFLQEVLKACERYMEVLKSAARNTVSLSPRELEILVLAAEGLKRNEIAGRLHLSSGTVQTHLHNIYGKLEVGGRTAAIKKAQIMKLL